MIFDIVFGLGDYLIVGSRLLNDFFLVFYLKFQVLRIWEVLIYAIRWFCCLLLLKKFLLSNKLLHWHLSSSINGYFTQWAEAYKYRLNNCDIVMFSSQVNLFHGLGSMGIATWSRFPKRLLLPCLEFSIINYSTWR